jgi:adenine-specific DNA-methyltransferase
MMPTEKNLDSITYSLEVGQHILSKRTEKQRKQVGQFFTPAPVARFMAQQLGPIRPGDRILDPAVGSGVLACAIVERAIAEGSPREFWLDGYEIDPELCRTAKDVLARAAERAEAYGITVHTEVYEGDFVLNSVPEAQPYLFLAETTNQPNPQALYNQIIANPPYFKLNSDDSRVKLVAGRIKGHTNIYTLFLAMAARKLVPGGRACFIVPRSFCSGAYFSALRQSLVEDALPLAVHLFQSRQDTFTNDSVLQENVIFTFKRREAHSRTNFSSAYLNISTSKDAEELDNTPLSRQISFEQFLAKRYGHLFFRLPTGELDEQIVEIVDGWAGSLSQYGLNVSTGPVVAFRARSWLVDDEKATAQNQFAPLLWMHNVRQQQVEWPVANGHKSQRIDLNEETRSLLVPLANYVLIRRFSAKEEPRRLIAAPFLASQYDFQWLGLENHLNYIYRKQGELDTAEALGLSAFLASGLMDRYFRIVNGNTQVNAAELRALPLPPLELIKQIGQTINANETTSPVDIDAVVFHILGEAGYLTPDFPIIRETRITMGKIQEAQDVLKTLGLPPGQQNEISALTFLVLAQLSEEISWGEAKRQSLRIHDILITIKEFYGREYAENTRETIRRQVIHQFIQAGLVVRNPDDPTLPTNSPRTHYALSDLAIRTIRNYRSKDDLTVSPSPSLAHGDDRGRNPGRGPGAWRRVGRG